MDLRSIDPVNVRISTALERTAIDAGMSVTRLGDDSILCCADKPMIFWGFAGPSTCQVARILCRNPSWLLRYLQSQDVSVTDYFSSELAFAIVVDNEVVAEAGLAGRTDAKHLRAAAIAAITAVPMLQYGYVAFGNQAAEPMIGGTALGVMDIDLYFNKWARLATDEEVAQLASAVLKAEVKSAQSAKQHA